MAASGGEVTKIKELWKAGEQLSTSGKHPDALLHFARAKALLLLESKKLLCGEDAVQINYNSITTSGGANSKLMGDILTKLTASINRDIKLINANPVHALGLSRGFSKSDVKKAHRKAALLYHPDKNPDCDTANIFSAVQSAYEKLKATLDSAPAGSGISPRGGGGGGSGGGRSSKAYQDFGDDDPPSKYGSFKTHKDVGRRGTSSAGYKVPPRNGGKPSPYEFDQARTAAGASGRGKAGSKGAGAGAGGHSSASAASAVSGMTTEHLRVLLKQFGFDANNVDHMTRGELIKKYLAVSAHMDSSADGEAQAPGEMFDDAFFSFDAPDYADPKAFGAGAEAAFKRLAKEWSGEWARQMQGEIDRDTQRRAAAGIGAAPVGANGKPVPSYRLGQNRKQAPIPEGDAVPGYEFTHIPGQGMTRPGGKVNRGKAAPSPYSNSQYTKQKAVMVDEERQLRAEHKREEELKKNMAHTRAQLGATRKLQADEEQKRGALADALRSERATWMREKLPFMSVAELRRIVQASGMDLDGCVDRLQLASRLARHYGIPLDDAIIADIKASNKNNGKNRAGSGSGSASNGGGVSAAEAAMNSRFASGSASGPLDPLPSRPDSKGGHSAPGSRSTPREQDILDSAPVPAVSEKMDPSELKKVVQASSMATGVAGVSMSALVSGSGYITKEKLAALEKRVLGGGQKRSFGRDKPTSEPEPVEEVETVEPSGATSLSLDDVLASAAIDAARDATADTLLISSNASKEAGSGGGGDDDIAESGSDMDSDDDIFLEQLRRRGWDVGAFPHGQGGDKTKSIAERDKDENANPSSKGQGQVSTFTSDLPLSARSSPGTAHGDDYDEPAAEATNLTPGTDRSSSGAVEAAAARRPRPSSREAAQMLSRLGTPPTPQLGMFDMRDKEQILAFEMLLQQAEVEAEEAVNPALPMGGGRIRPRSGASSREGTRTSESAPVAEGVIAAAIARASPSDNGGKAKEGGGKGKATTAASLKIDLSQLKTQQQQAAADESKAVQEEVDFWVHSARSDADAGRQTYRELENELKKQVELDKQDLKDGRYLRASNEGYEGRQGLAAARDGSSRPSSAKVLAIARPRASSPIVSPNARQRQRQRQEHHKRSPYSSDGEEGGLAESNAGTDTGTDTDTDHIESDRSTGGDPLELSVNPKAGFLFFG